MTSPQRHQALFSTQQHQRPPRGPPSSSAVQSARRHDYVVSKESHRAVHDLNREGDRGRGQERDHDDGHAKDHDDDQVMPEATLRTDEVQHQVSHQLKPLLPAPNEHSQPFQLLPPAACPTGLNQNDTQYNTRTRLLQLKRGPLQQNANLIHRVELSSTLPLFTSIQEQEHWQQQQHQQHVKEEKQLQEQPTNSKFAPGSLQMLFTNRLTSKLLSNQAHPKPMQHQAITPRQWQQEQPTSKSHKKHQRQQQQHKVHATTEQERINERNRKGRERSLRTRRRNAIRLQVLEQNIVYLTTENNLLRDIASMLTAHATKQASIPILLPAAALMTTPSTSKTPQTPPMQAGDMTATTPTISSPTNMETTTRIDTNTNTLRAKCTTLVPTQMSNSSPSWSSSSTLASKTESGIDWANHPLVISFAALLLCTASKPPLHVPSSSSIAKAKHPGITSPGEAGQQPLNSMPKVPFLRRSQTPIQSLAQPFHAAEYANPLEKQGAGGGIQKAKSLHPRKVGKMEPDLIPAKTDSAPATLQAEAINDENKNMDNKNGNGNSSSNNTYMARTILGKFIHGSNDTRQGDGTDTVNSNVGDHGNNDECGDGSGDGNVGEHDHDNPDDPDDKQTAQEIYDSVQQMTSTWPDITINADDIHLPQALSASELDELLQAINSAQTVDTPPSP